ncbi:MAG: DNA polymerase I, partial [Sphingomonadales bacterium]
YTCRAVEAGWDVTIVSSDKDLMQLIAMPGVDMLDTMKNERRGADYVLGKFGVRPEQLGDVLALMGDTVDNVPGVPGIGPKTAAKLIGEFKTLEKVLEEAPNMKPSKMRDNLIEHREMALLSRKLVALHCDTAVPMTLDELKLDGIPPEPLRNFLEDQGFKTLLSRMAAHAPGRDTADPVAAAAALATNDTPDFLDLPPIDCNGYETVTTVEQLEAWIAASHASGTIAIDTETDSLDSMAANLVGICLATAPGKACYIPIAHRSGDDMFAEAPPQLSLNEVTRLLRPLLVDPSVLKIGHNIKYDLNVLIRHGMDVSPIDDTMVMSFDLDAGQSLAGHGMDEVAHAVLEHSCITFKDVTGTGKKAISFAQVPLDQATQYGGEDADVTWRLWTRFKPRLAYEGATRIYEMVDRPLIPVVAGMERAGIKVDRDQLSHLSSRFAQEMARLEEEIQAEAGQPFQIGSTQQLGAILFDKMGLKGGKKGKSGAYSTDVTVLERMKAEGVAIAGLVLEWRQLSKLKSTYTDALQQQIDRDTGRVHTSYSLTGAQTGRLSSTDPNLQNIPIRTEIGRQIRDA